MQDELAVNYCQLAVVATDSPEVTAAFRAGLGATFTFLSDEERRAIPARGPGARGLTMHFEHAVDEVDDPVVGDSRARVRPRLASSRDAQSGLGDLDDQRGLGRMRVRIVTRRAAHDANVRLRLRSIAE